MVKIAVASTDGKLVNQHFGKCSKFSILTVDEEKNQILSVLEREVTPVCNGGDHDNGKLILMVHELDDCQIILVSRIGNRARNELEKKEKEIYEIPGIISEVVNKVIRYRKVQKLFTN